MSREVENDHEIDDDGRFSLNRVDEMVLLGYQSLTHSSLCPSSS